LRVWCVSDQTEQRQLVCRAGVDAGRDRPEGGCALSLVYRWITRHNGGERLTALGGGVCYCTLGRRCAAASGDYT